MKAAVVVFPASNCDRDAAVALEQVAGEKPAMVWHADTELPDVQLVVLPGGFAHGDYLRCGAMAALSPIMRDIKTKADKGLPVLGICNGFQILVEAGLLPGVLMRNANLRFVCRMQHLAVERVDTPFTSQYAKGQIIKVAIAHGEGNYVADAKTIARIEGEGRVAFRYADGDNPNGSARNIAGILNEKRNVLGLMPHPERVCDPLLGGTDGRALFESLLESLS